MDGMASDVVLSFVEAVLRNDLATAKSLWTTHQPALREDFVAAAIAGDLDAVKGLLAADRTFARRSLPPMDRPILCYVCGSRLIADPEFEAGILAVAEFLLKSGVDPDSYFAADWGTEEWKETALYGAAGVLNHPGLTKLLLDAGADPDDGAIQRRQYDVLVGYSTLKRRPRQIPVRGFDPSLPLFSEKCREHLNIGQLR